MNAYENAKLYKDRTKFWHDKHLIKKEFQEMRLFSFLIQDLSYFRENWNHVGQVHLKLLRYILMVQ